MLAKLKYLFHYQTDGSQQATSERGRGGGHSPCSLYHRGRHDGDGGIERRGKREKQVSLVGISRFSWAERVRFISYRCVLELVRSLCSRGLGMYQLITQTECEQTGCTRHLRALLLCSRHGEALCDTRLG